MICQLDGCSTKQSKPRAFFCDRHWKKVPIKVRKEVNKLWDNNPDGVIKEDLDYLIVKATYSLKLEDYEKRTKFHFKKHDQRRAKEKIFIVTGADDILKKERREMLETLRWVIDEYDLTKKVHVSMRVGNALMEEFEKTPYCSVIALNRPGIIAMIDNYHKKNGLIHGSNVVLSPEEWEEHVWSNRPASATHSTNKFFSAPFVYCDASLENVEDLEDEGPKAISRALDWANMFVWKGRK